MNTINISGMNKAEVLAKLFNASKQQGMGFMHGEGRQDMTIAQAGVILDTGQMIFDYLKGRVMKIDLSGDELRTHLYDRDNGQGAAAMALGVSE